MKKMIEGSPEWPLCVENLFLLTVDRQHSDELQPLEKSVVNVLLG